jgi:hypothetical protein
VHAKLCTLDCLPNPVTVSALRRWDTEMVSSYTARSVDVHVSAVFVLSFVGREALAACNATCSTKSLRTRCIHDGNGSPLGRIGLRRHTIGAGRRKRTRRKVLLSGGAKLTFVGRGVQLSTD